MFSKFITAQGVRFVKTEHIISIADIGDEGQCTITWLVGDEMQMQRVAGTAQENFDRLKAEELELISAAAERQARVDRNLPLLPVQRGRATR